MTDAEEIIKSAFDVVSFGSPLFDLVGPIYPRKEYYKAYTLKQLVKHRRKVKEYREKRAEWQKKHPNPWWESKLIPRGAGNTVSIPRITSMSFTKEEDNA